MLCLQEKKLLESGDYMVISVNDEFYNPDSKPVQDSKQSKLVKSTYMKECKESNLIVELLTII